MPRNRSWLERHWKWFLPVGIVAVAFLLAVFVGLIVFGVMGGMKSSDAYKIPVAVASADDRVQAALGTPVKPGWFFTGNMSSSGTRGHADLSIPISGPQGSGTLYVVADKSAGQWKFSTLVAEIASTRERIDLSTNASAATR